LLPFFVLWFAQTKTCANEYPCPNLKVSYVKSPIFLASLHLPNISGQTPHVYMFMASVAFNCAVLSVVVNVIVYGFKSYNPKA
jgi:energy-converting hydrogenase Eha subunit A